MTDAVNRFSVTLPAGYRSITDMAQVRSLMRAGAASNPSLRAAVAQYEALGDHARVFAYKLGPTRFADNVNILATPAGGLDADQIGDVYGQVKPALEGKLKATITDHRIVTVAGTKALRVEYRVTVSQHKVLGTQVYLIHNGKALITTITQSQAKASKAEADMIIDGIRFR